MTVLSVLQTYNTLLYTRPLLTKACTSGVTAGLGDLLGQLISKQKTINSPSVARYAFYGFFIVAPLAHSFYKLLEDVVPPNSSAAGLKRLLMDRLGFTPLLLLIALYLLPRMEGKSHRKCVSEVKSKYWMALKMNWKVWTPFQYINVNYIPQAYRVLFANIVAIFWIMYISNKRRQAAAAAASKEH